MSNYTTSTGRMAPPGELVERNPRLDAALRAVELDLAVVPLHYPRFKDDGTVECSCGNPRCGSNTGKHPMSRRGKAFESSTDPDQVRRWWAAYPNANVGIDLAKSRVVDVSSDSVEWHRRFVELGMPATVRWTSGGGEGHEHALYRVPEGTPIERICESGKFDILSGGISVFAGSTHYTGRAYELLCDAPVAAAEQWMVDRLVEHAERKLEAVEPIDPNEPPVRLTGSALRYWTGESAVFRDGEPEVVDRSGTLLRIATHLARGGMTRRGIDAALRDRDAVLFANHPEGPKYVDRSDADVRYAELVDLGMKHAGVGTISGDAEGEGILFFSDMQSRPVRWLWQHRIPLSAVSMVDGDPGLGKSTLMADIAARVTTGTEMPDGLVAVGMEKGAGVLILSAEDDLEATVRPRLQAAGADLSRIATIGVRNEKYVAASVIALPDDLDRVERAIEAVDAKLVIVDPVVAYLSEKVNSHSDAAVRRVLAKLVQLAARTGVAVIAVRHINKSGAGKALYRGGGSIGFIASARAGMLVAPHPDDPDLRVLAMTKANLGPRQSSLTYRLESFTVSSGIDVSRVVWEDEVEDITADALLGTTDDDRAPVRAAARAFLEDMLKDGPVLGTKVQEAAKDMLISITTLRRASDELGILKTRLPGRGYEYFWRLPDTTVEEYQNADGGDHGEGDQ